MIEMLTDDHFYSNETATAVDSISHEQRLAWVLSGSPDFARLNMDEWSEAVDFLIANPESMRMDPCAMFVLATAGIRERKARCFRAIMGFMARNDLKYYELPQLSTGVRFRLKTPDGRQVDVWPHLGHFRVQGQGVRKVRFLEWAEENLIA